MKEIIHKKKLRWYILGETSKVNFLKKLKSHLVWTVYTIKKFYDRKILVCTLASTLYHQVIVVHFDCWNKLKWKSGNSRNFPISPTLPQKKNTNF